MERVLRPTPSVRWHAEDAPRRALRFTLVRAFSADALAALRGRHRTTPGIPCGRQRSDILVLEAAPFRRTDWSSTGGAKPDTTLLEVFGDL